MQNRVSSYVRTAMARSRIRSKARLLAARQILEVESHRYGNFRETEGASSQRVSKAIDS